MAGSDLLLAERLDAAQTLPFREGVAEGEEGVEVGGGHLGGGGSGIQWVTTSRRSAAPSKYP